MLSTLHTVHSLIGWQQQQQQQRIAEVHYASRSVILIWLQMSRNVHYIP